MGGRSGGGASGGMGSRSGGFARSAGASLKGWLGAGASAVVFTSSPKNYKEAAKFKAAGGHTDVFGKSRIKVDGMAGLNKASEMLKGTSIKVTGFTLSHKTPAAKKEPKYTSTGRRIGQKTFSPKSNASNWNNWQWSKRK